MIGAFLRLIAIYIFIALCITACSDSSPVFYDSGTPQRLSEWNLFDLTNMEFTPVEASLVFRPTNQLFTDYAHKLRTLWLPRGEQATLVDGEFDYPVGTILSKTFYYPLNANGEPLKAVDLGLKTLNLRDNLIVETRLLVKRTDGWTAFPYVWNDEQTEAFLRVAGASKNISLKSDTGTLNFTYFVPNENQCSACHVTEHPDGEMHPLGAIASQLNAPFSLDDTNSLLQTKILQKKKWLKTLPDIAETLSWMDESLDTDTRALAYLNIHCGHCHNPNGAADTSALLLDGSHDLSINLGVCKPPVAAGGGAGDLLYGLVPGAPEESILIYRMDTTAPDEMMPELGRSLIHSEGVELISSWVSQLPGNCRQ
jgi:uncharacterized repeat protein (TIGR03806 family)